jgi:hypothetical protein
MAWRITAKKEEEGGRGKLKLLFVFLILVVNARIVGRVVVYVVKLYTR